jgi:hypothetical protein
LDLGAERVSSAGETLLFGHAPCAALRDRLVRILSDVITTRAKMAAGMRAGVARCHDNLNAEHDSSPPCRGALNGIARGKVKGER